MRHRLITVLAALPTVAVLVACGSSSTGPGAASGGLGTPAGGTAGGTSSDAHITGTIHVFAAASLTETFTALGKSFQAAHPGTKVVLNFGASSTLALQIDQGAPADVFASASPKNMDQVRSQGNAGPASTFAVNRMEVVVPPDNPAHINRVEDLARSGIKVALCQEQVPCGATAAEVFAKAHITVKPVTREPDVKSALAKVTLGEVDAAVVYVTDAKAAGTKVVGIPIPESINSSTSYPIAALRHAKNAAGAAAFVAYVSSPTARSVLAAAGFGPPQ